MSDLHSTDQSRRRFVHFSETNRRYEGGLKAWIFPAVYLVGALCLEAIIHRFETRNPVILGIGFLGYLVLFPLAWGRIAKSFMARKPRPDFPDHSSAVERR